MKRGWEVGLVRNSMNDIKTKQHVWSTLPLPIRELPSAENTAERIEAVGQKHGLGLMEQGFLVRITSNLLRGVIAPREFVSIISKETGTPREKAAEIAQEINRDIFNEVKDALKQVHAVEGTAKVAEKVAPIDPSLVTCLPEGMSKEAALGNKAPGNAASTGSIFEQKLGGVFRMKGEAVATAGSAPAPTLVTPPPPQTLRPASPLPPAPKPALDPYREHPV